MSKYVPVYKQLREMLRTQIETGQLPVGTTLPPEVELAGTFGVSRATMRNAILDLVEDGLIKRKPGAGTVVIRSKPEEHRSYFRGLTEDLRRRGISSSASVLSAEVTRPNDAIADHLKLTRGESALKLTRLRSIASGVPLALLHSYVPEWVGIKVDDDFTRPLYELVESVGKLHIIYGHDVIGASAATAEQAELLDVAVGAPLLSIRRTTFVEHERPVEYVQAYLRNDLYEYHAVLPRETGR